MNSLITFLESDFNTQRDQWEKTLLRELKIPEVGNKTHKKLMGSLLWPTLSLEARSSVQLTSSEWKKSSNTYVNFSDEALLQEDLDSGVRNFFFYNLNEKKWKSIENIIAGFPHKKEVEVFILDGQKFQSESYKVFTEITSGKTSHDHGGHAIQELGLMASELVRRLDTLEEIVIGVYVDSHFFQNIAKLRAARLLAMKILEEKEVKKNVKIVSLSSFQGWTLFERYSNMLRNETAVAASYIGGADYIQSSGYNSLIEMETDSALDEHHERSLRMARNTSHILALESMLGVVQDASFGSFHLENLTESLCEEAWKTMQRFLQGEDLSAEIQEVKNQRLQMIKTRKSILSGINDYPDVKEQLNFKLKPATFFRTARIFEELRLKIQESKKPEVFIALYGDYGQLNARLNFVKNYFELLGLAVHEPGHSITSKEEFKKIISGRKEEIFVLCSSDESYPELIPLVQEVKASHYFIAGKFEMSGYSNLFAGQNIYEVLENIVAYYSGRKS